MRHLLRGFWVTLCLALLFWQATAQDNANAFSAFLGDLRNDLEVLADRVYGGGSRPTTWTGNGDPNSTSIIADLWFDNEQMADEVFGRGARPPRWIGATTSNANLVARSIRHDLELAADTFIGENLRPNAWRGASRVFRCERTVQNTLYLLRTIYNITPTTPESVVNYCAAVVGEVENELINATFGTEAGAQANIPTLILAVRGDLERLADEKLGLNTRPEGWRSNKDVNSPTLAADNFADLELLADTLVGLDQRPTGWIGALSGSAVLSYRNLRFDLELLADFGLGEGVRPRGWQGQDLVARCSSSVQNLVLLVQRSYEYTPSPVSSTDTEVICASIEAEANLLAENPPQRTTAETQAEEEGKQFMAEARYAFAYLDPAALQFMGSIPAGVKFRAWYRNFGESTMMFVSGDNFAVFIDRRWTTLTEEAFVRLPTLDGRKPLTFCNADWCNGPRATPTPTGGGPLIEIITAATPPATLAPGANVDAQGKRLVSWNHVRVTYVLQRPEVNAAQVTLEICQEPTQINCEPVRSVLNTLTGVTLPVLSTSNGLAVFELPYGYSTNLRLEGTTLFSQDVWLNDPSLSQ
jgi:hypothetical protein